MAAEAETEHSLQGSDSEKKEAWEEIEAPVSAARDREGDNSEKQYEAIRTNTRTGSQRPHPAPLRQTRSRSSARSHRSYDGYTVDDRDHDGTNEEESSKNEFEVQFDGDSDPMDPKNRPEARKWLVVFIVSAGSLCVTCASSLYTSTYDQMEVEFGVSRLVATIGLTTYVVGLGLGPMFLSPLSEFYGRRNIYICAFGMFLIWLIPCAVAPNIATMLVARFFDGLAGSAFLSVAGGTVGDMFTKDKLSAPMMIYTASPFMGPEVGPLIGGFINQFADWRWSFYVLIIWAGIQWILIVAFVPETYAPVLLRRKAMMLRKEKNDDRWKAPIEIMDRSITQTVLWSCIRPFQLLCFETMVLLLCLLSAILLGILYLFFGAFALVFQNNHGFNQWQTGLSFLGILVGMLIGVSCDPLWRRNYIRLVDKNDGISEPEFRLPPTILGAVLVPVSLFGFGWTTFSRVHWIAPIIFSGLFGLGNIFCFSGIFTFLVETYPLYAASALAANSFARSSFAAAFPLFGVQMYNHMGYQWASSLLAFIALAMVPFPYLFFKHGKQLRAKSRYAQSK
ncbi:unnamed protein product [Zymoseptoria tritici ST99CH_3D7]|uniref:Major facilitator superfamily (MFS) profile domain-containing protein n=2 Tax=Zymoseptoria tritici TaxID=1047171 RepID=A0A1X7RQR1_ZYMT9|nr:unnamed protein product [Zymoseptoria tritici ST99CH_3D7]SMR50532.1 unnamed protein product [Zymoseptoria tritici ST99CH_1E4]